MTVLEPIPRAKLPKLRHIIKFFFEKDYKLNFYDGPAGQYVEMYSKKDYPENRIGTYDIHYCTFILIPRLLQCPYIMYSPVMLERHIDELYSDFTHKHLKTDKTENYVKETEAQNTEDGPAYESYSD